MKSIIGICLACGGKIGRKSANKVYRHGSNMRQVALVFRNPEAEVRDENGTLLRPAEQRLHIPVCAQCCAEKDEIDLDIVKVLLAKEAGAIRIFRDFVFDRVEVDPVIAGQRIE